ncbi:MAG: Helix-turn-helix domain [Firmicutes bacterium]|nr:Helix-turn-helix domain [Bacillota bacterium]
MNNAIIAQNIREIRIKKGITQADICRMLDKPKGWLSRRECCRTKISVYDFCLLADVLRVPGDVFFRGH